MTSANKSLNLFFSKNTFLGSFNSVNDVINNELPECCFLGRSNVGKSSLLNRFLSTDRVMVDNKPGTTRDPVEAPFNIGEKKFMLVDTAGIRRVNKLKDHIDKISVIYSEKVIEDSDMAIFVLDATRPLSQQDKRIAGKVVEEQKPCILVINKSLIYIYLL